MNAWLRCSWILMLCWAAPVSGDIVLVERGMPKAAIVVGAKASPQALESADILQEYVEKISGAWLEIRREEEAITGPRILVGRSAAVQALGVELPHGYSSQMNEEGFVVKTLGEDLVLAGNEDWNYRGTAFAVCDFLERDLGCRWFFPGPFGEVVPQHGTIAVGDLDRVETPDFRIRLIWYAGWMPISAEDGAWMRRWSDLNKINSVGLSLPGDGSISRLAPPDAYFDSHPEIFAIDKEGNRVREMMCMSEPEAVRIGVETIKETFRKDPDVFSFGFAPADGFPMCHCPRCQSHFPGFMGKGYGDPSLSEVWFQFANQIASEIYKEFPDRWVLTNGYANRVRLPESVAKLSPNLGIQSAIIAACSIHRIGDPKCWQRRAYQAVIDRWMRDLDCMIVYDYDPGKSLENLPFPTLHCIKHDLPYFHQGGLWGFWTEGSNSWMVTHLNYYVRAKLMWDVDADVDALVREYCELFYGPSADAVEDYLWTLDRAVEDSTTHETWGRLMQWRVILPPVIETLDALMAQAETLAVDPVLQQRVHVLRLTHDHMRAFLAMENAAADGKFNDALAQAVHMIALRTEAATIQSGLLPPSTDIARDHASSVEGHRGYYEYMAERIDGPRGELVAMLPRTWEFKQDPKDMGTLEQWYLPDKTDGWEPLDVTFYWEAQGHQDEEGWGYAGKAWYATDFDVPADAEGKPLYLSVGGAYNEGIWVWVNGVMRDFEKSRHWRLGFQESTAPFDVPVTDLIRPGETNRVAILVNTGEPGRNPRGGLHRRVMLWAAKDE